MDLRRSDSEVTLAAAISREAALTLRATPAALDTLLAAPLLAQAIPGLASAQTLDAAYYDTADLQLAKRGIGLSVHHEGGRFIQSLKLDGMAAAPGERRQWRTVVPDLTPRPDWILEPDARAVLGHIAPDELREIYRTRFARDIRVIGYPYGGDIAVVEIALDRGTLEAGDAVAPTAEVELELLKGSPQALYALALALHELAPLQIETRSKAERARALFSGDAPAWHKAQKLAFAADATVDDGIAAIFASCLSHWLANVPAALDGRDPEGLHQVRVALRRLRSALALFDGVLPMMQASWLNSECRWLTRALGPARNWDAFLESVLLPLEAKRPGDPTLAALRAQCEKARVRNYELARAAIASPRYTAFVLNYSAWLEDSWWHRTPNITRREILGAPLKAYADTVLERRHRKLLKRGRGLREATPQQRHKLRIAVKKLRYACDFFGSLYASKKARLLRRDLARLQDTLGDLNDLTVTERLLETIIYQAVGDPAHDDVARAVGLVVGWGTARARRSEAELLGDWKRCKRRPPYWRRPHPD